MFLLGFFDIRLSKTRKIRNSAKISGQSISDPFLASKTDPVFLFLAPFSVSWPRKSGNFRAKCRDKSRKVRFSPILLLPGSILEPPGTISEAPGPDFGAILHKPGQEVRKLRIPKNRRDFPWFYDENPPFSLL